MKDKLMH